MRLNPASETQKNNYSSSDGGTVDHLPCYQPSWMAAISRNWLPLLYHQYNRFEIKTKYTKFGSIQLNHLCQKWVKHDGCCPIIREVLCQWFSLLWTTIFIVSSTFTMFKLIQA